MEVTEVEVGVILAGSGTPSTTPSSDEIIDDANDVLARPSNGSLWDLILLIFHYKVYRGCVISYGAPSYYLYSTSLSPFIS